MQTKMNAVLAVLALASVSTLPAAADDDPMRVEIKYDRTAPVDTTFNRARAIARKACQINGRVAPMKRLLEKTCVAPLLSQYVLQTENQELIAYYERRLGEPPVFVPFVAD